MCVYVTLIEIINSIATSLFREGTPCRNRNVFVYVSQSHPTSEKKIFHIEIDVSCGPHGMAMGFRQPIDS